MGIPFKAVPADAPRLLRLRLCALIQVKNTRQLNLLVRST